VVVGDAGIWITAVVHGHRPPGPVLAIMMTTRWDRDVSLRATLEDEGAESYASYHEAPLACNHGDTGRFGSWSGSNDCKILEVELDLELKRWKPPCPSKEERPQ
jgi:hypothetical protein